MAFTIVFTRLASEELRAVKPFARRRLIEEIDAQLTHSPNIETRNRKRLDGVIASFAFDPPLWELRVGEWRVFYDLDVLSQQVVIRSVRRKRPDRTTQEVLNEADTD